MKPVHWIASSKRDLQSFPSEVQYEAGYSIYLAQLGDKGVNDVPMLGFGGAGIVEVIINDASGTYRVIYTLKLKNAVYVLHAFQKKSTKGKATNQHDLDLVKRRLIVAKSHHKVNYENIVQEKQHDRSA